ncbi:hypothetical protein HIM_03796 [Hirsutella minnesotensis 3608]|uniref:Major facilitator superfamily (MFS) profile domain-containing protein n=1 Tax=Hirsutella minnesotensis 3608 TaxID=1043627 RepID=A0A0F8A6E1_9HYPO|nr:hypothetical protein HIM_03796 [Hirsutella minnesotensis 3608]
MAPGSRRLYALCLHFAVGASIWGYNIGILSSVLVHPGWRSALHRPSAPQTGAVTAVYYAGTFVSWVSGVGVGVISTCVPLYQSEVSPARKRGRFVTMNHVGFVAGVATGLWVGYGMTFWTGRQGHYWGWRISILIQLVPAIWFALGLYFVPDTPRWLAQRGDMDGAARVLQSLREGTCSPEAVADELDAIRADVASRAAATRALFRKPGLFARLWRAFLLQFMAQMCGATAMKYYLPTLLRALGVSTRLALMAGAIEMTAKIGMTVVEMWAIDVFGRRLCLVGGSLVMGLGMLINGALPLAYPNNVNKASDAVCIAFIFIYAMGYSLGLGPAAWVYSSEIFPTPVRARGLNLAASGGAIGSIVVAQIWPVGVAHLGSRIYFFFMAVNFACVPIIWFLYPETKARALEDMDELFQKSPLQATAESPQRVMAGDGRGRRADPELAAQTSNQSSSEEDLRLLRRTRV